MKFLKNLMIRKIIQISIKKNLRFITDSCKQFFKNKFKNKF